MSISLGGITLPDLEWEKDAVWSGVRASVVYTLGGVPVVWEQSVQGRPIDLIGADDYGWIDRATLLQVTALASIPNTSYTLVFEGVSYTVRFRNEEGAIEAEPIIPRSNHASGDYYNNVRIRLMEV